jgi:cation:H+ antiporter
MYFFVAQLIAGLVLLYFGGNALISGASRLALRMGFSTLIVGLTVVAFGTSAPELFVSLDAVLGGLDDVAVGNVVGSNICNIALIMGLAAVIRPIRINARLIKLDLPLLIMASVWLIIILLNDSVSRWEGVLSILGLLAYVAFNVWEANREDEPVKEELKMASPKPGGSLTRDLAFIGLGLVALALGAHWFVSGSVTAANLVGLSPAVIGLTIIAVGTSLPELAVTILASRRGQGDIAVGNVIGSNLFNIGSIMGITSVVHPMARGGIMWADLGVMLGLTLILVPMLFLGPRLTRFRGAILLACYFGYLAWRLFAVQG